ncbi:putative F-box protein At3g16210 [Daucus carota subsp. sativus]|uniref:F-box domain-containing protein n=2 Tax=Daucus carota subsp. sativus TaxID=79200 RepID=A0A175YHT9_DAUCS|nr:PREDICTED: putative F-box protein At3g16210 [Daucus carota subsp. sativus]XP_017226070.1 PREDICTED: putative F-box protein At3g16210 [Daucus carota subsp. sativus]XP_017226071.1 PREDICTED: putative F-box protein At3g16210 [Daucus carota subsp. sativus]XP_017226072.1 PREDICTED: putative F-box protein At3g16210 [Daucus carota subsp. sativus]
MEAKNVCNAPLSLQSIPKEMLKEILLLIPVKCLLNLRCVNKSFCSLVNTHLKRQILFLPCSKEQLADNGMRIISPDAGCGSVEKLVPKTSFFNEFIDSAKIYGYCNGLVCLILDMDRLGLWNPSSNEFKILPRTGNPFHGGVFYGMGNYDSHIDDYKLVRAAASRFKDDGELVYIDSPIKFEVFTGRSNSWRRIEDIGTTQCYLQKQAVHLCGSLYWLKQITTLDDAYVLSQCLVILCFDLADEKVREVRLPNEEFLILAWSRLGVLGGRLCVCSYEETDVKIRMIDFNEKASWSKVISVIKPTGSSFAIPICISRKWEVITLADGRDLVIYDSHGNSYRKIAVGDGQNLYNAAFYVESLVRLGPRLS